MRTQMGAQVRSSVRRMWEPEGGKAGGLTARSSRSLKDPHECWRLKPFFITPALLTCCRFELPFGNPANGKAWSKETRPDTGTYEGGTFPEDQE